MLLATWNVLHRIHAENWHEGPIDRFPREADRIGAITARVVAIDAAVICLQEVSGDQLASLRAAMPLATGALVFATRYPRVPSPRVAATPENALVEPSESLVTIVRVGTGGVLAGVAFDDDHGKGFLATELDGGVVVINTHVTFGAKRRGQLARIAATVRATGTTIIAGDFNADRATVAADLGAGFTVAVPTDPALPTRPRTTPSGKSQTIDHVIVRGGLCLACTVVDVGGLSDHNLVTARVEQDPGPRTA